MRPEFQQRMLYRARDCGARKVPRRSASDLCRIRVGRDSSGSGDKGSERRQRCGRDYECRGATAEGETIGGGLLAKRIFNRRQTSDRERRADESDDLTFSGFIEDIGCRTQEVSDPHEQLMAQRKQETFTVTDRRLFTADGELRKDVPEEPEQERPVTTKAPAAAPESPAQESSSEQAPELQGPSAAEQQEQAHAYQKSSAEMDRQAEANGISAKEMEITFERFLASLYMTEMIQLGLMP